jgi:hypothetical protein
MIVDMLQAELPAPQESPAPPLPSRNTEQREWALNQRRMSLEDVVQEQESPSGPGPDVETPMSNTTSPQTTVRRDPKTALVDKSLDASLRVEAAIALGQDGLAHLGSMLREGGNEREVAFVALGQLAEDPRLARQIHNQMKLLESEPDVRRTAECIRRGIESGSGGWAGNQRHLGDQARIGDGWLSRAIASCDRPGILQAAAGREVYAIPLALRQLAKLRSRRLGERG